MKAEAIAKVQKANAEGMVIPVTFTKIVKAVQAR